MSSTQLKHRIAVINTPVTDLYSAVVSPETTVIYRVLTAEQIGNFNPIFCTYKGMKCLVESLEGDLSDPFRREVSYLDSLYIEPYKNKKEGRK